MVTDGYLWVPKLTMFTGLVSIFFLTGTICSELQVSAQQSVIPRVPCVYHVNHLYSLSRVAPMKVSSSRLHHLVDFCRNWHYYSPKDCYLHIVNIFVFITNYRCSV